MSNGRPFDQSDGDIGGSEKVIGGGEADDTTSNDHDVINARGTHVEMRMTMTRFIFVKDRFWLGFTEPSGPGRSLDCLHFRDCLSEYTLMVPFVCDCF